MIEMLGKGPRGCTWMGVKEGSMSCLGRAITCSEALYRCSSPLSSTTACI